MPRTHPAEAEWPPRCNSSWCNLWAAAPSRDERGPARSPPPTRRRGRRRTGRPKRRPRLRGVPASDKAPRRSKYAPRQHSDRHRQPQALLPSARGRNPAARTPSAPGRARRGLGPDPEAQHQLRKQPAMPEPVLMMTMRTQSPLRHHQSPRGKPLQRPHSHRRPRGLLASARASCAAGFARGPRGPTPRSRLQRRRRRPEVRRRRRRRRWRRRRRRRRRPEEECRWRKRRPRRALPDLTKHLRHPRPRPQHRCSQHAPTPVDGPRMRGNHHFLCPRQEDAPRQPPPHRRLLPMPPATPRCSSPAAPRGAAKGRRRTRAHAPPGPPWVCRPSRHSWVGQLQDMPGGCRERSKRGACWS
mmetsp:Transcript_51188/g.165801  ORF Transcript_51188/g.165801 Transcript_51188/m.165801 type:complete len:357 (+) Transcript_51188:1271-2341(+)